MVEFIFSFSWNLQTFSGCDVVYAIYVKRSVFYMSNYFKEKAKDMLQYSRYISFEKENFKSKQVFY